MDVIEDISRELELTSDLIKEIILWDHSYKYLWTKKYKAELKRTSCSITPALAVSVRKIARRLRVTQSSVVTCILSKYLDQVTEAAKYIVEGNFSNETD